MHTWKWDKKTVGPPRRPGHGLPWIRYACMRVKIGIGEGGDDSERVAENVGFHTEVSQASE